MPLTGEILAVPDHVPYLTKLWIPLWRVQRESFGAEGQETVQLGSVTVSGPAGGPPLARHRGARYREPEDADSPLRLWGTRGEQSITGWGWEQSRGRGRQAWSTGAGGGWAQAGKQQVSGRKSLGAGEGGGVGDCGKAAPAPR